MITKPQWKKLAEFDGGNGIVVVVNYLPLVRPRFSMEIGKKLENGVLARHIPVGTSGQGRIDVDSVWSKVGSAVAKAEVAIFDAAQKAEDAVLDARIAKEEQELNRGRPIVARTGKTEQKRQAAKLNGTKGE